MFETCDRGCVVDEGKVWRTMGKHVVGEDKCVVDGGTCVVDERKVVNEGWYVVDGGECVGDERNVVNEGWCVGDGGKMWEIKEIW